MNISIFGLGYVGIVALGCLAKLGNKVIGVDVNSSKVHLLNNGKSSIIEAQLSEIIEQQRLSGNISATTDASVAVSDSDISFICVGTPPSPEGHLSLDAIYKVAHQIGSALQTKNSFHVIAIRSTVPLQTSVAVARIIAEASGKQPDRDFAIVSNPEFLREGTAVSDFMNPSHTILASTSSRAIDEMRKVYSDLPAPIIVTSVAVAEMIKYVNNAFHAVKVTFANEIGNICKKMNVDSHELMRIFSMDTKLNLSSYYLKPGFAYGGSCLPKDLTALSIIAHDCYLKCPLIESVSASNEHHKELILEQILSSAKQRIGFLGLSFKAGTDDLRSSPIIDVLEKLLGKGFDVLIYDKNVNLSQLIGTNKEYILQRIPFISKFLTTDPDMLLDKSDLLVVVKDEPEHRSLLERIKKDTAIYDLVNIPFSGREHAANYKGLAW